MSRPAWQTDELVEEWVDHEEASSVRWQDSVSSRGTSSDLSLTEALPSTFAPENTSSVTTSSVAPGTFVVREDVPAVSLLPRTPGHKNKDKMKDFFSPMALERMFEPPSPPKRSTDPPIPSTSHHATAPAIPSRLSKVHYPDESIGELDPNEIIETDMPHLAAFDPRKPSSNGQFTFSFPQSTPNLSPIPQSTPTTRSRVPNNPPPTDPRLRLFQFQYDTFTREHLSAMVDSIAVNGTPSAGSNATPTLSAHVSAHFISHISEAEDESLSRMRSSKRIKLSPAVDYADEETSPSPALLERPNSRRDYVGESKNLMEQIRQARDFSTISTNAPSRVIDRSAEESMAHTPAPSRRLRPPSFMQASAPSSATNTVNSKRSIYSSLGYRQEAADLMAQIKSDITTTRRLFSSDTELSHVTRIASNGLQRAKEFEESLHSTRGHGPPEEDPAHDASNMSIEVWQPQAVTTPRPPQLAIIPATPTETVTIRQQIQAQHLPLQYNGPSHPQSNRSGANEDLSRFVSSSTTTTGTTLTSGSAGSFIKHAGPKQMRRIGPEDVIGALSDKVGQMVLDRKKMKWVKDTAPAFSAAVRVREEDEESEDPFRDFESLRDEDSAQPSEQEEESESRIEEIVEDADDPEEAVLNSFSFDDSSAAICPVMTGISRPEDEDSDSSGAVNDDPLTDSDESLEEFADNTERQHEEITDDISLREFPAPPPRSNAIFSTPLPIRPNSTTSAGATPFPSVGRSGTVKSLSTTPVSALKDPNRSRTPAGLKHRRSVSFSDGKREGPIRGLNSNVVEFSDSESANENLGVSGTGSLFELSVRSRRIAGMLDGLQDDYLDESPSKASSTARPMVDEIRPLSANNSTSLNRSNGDDPRRSLSRSQTHRPANPNATFLTECSFGVAHDRLVQVITDIQPFEPHWESLKSIDLSKKTIESVARLKEFLPQLDCLSLNENQISWLSGIPGTVRTLSIASNMLTDVTSFGHLTNLEHLDLSRNDIESLRQLDCLRSLRELRADGNKIKNIDGLQRLEGLVKLSLQSNQIRKVDLSGFRWSKLEMLNLSQNRLDSIQGLKMLGGLIALNLDNNGLSELGVEAGDGGDRGGRGCLGKLRILRVSGNKLQRLDGECFPNLRTLYADNNALSGISHCGRMRRLENLSVRNQAKGKLSISLRDVRDIKRLYVSGNPLSCKFMTEACYNLVYFELAACRLTSLPGNFSSLVPNVRVLNLNYNFLEDVGPLEGLNRIKKLSIIGSRVKGTKGLIRMVQRMGEIEMVDFRMNPCTLGWYLPLLVKDVPGALQPSDQDGDQGRRHGENSKGSGKSSSWQWEELDAKFRRDLPDESYVGRLAYRGLIMRACRDVKVLDGIQVSEKEREKAEKLLTGILRKRD
ncbi:hypothetical protein BJ322DRAFT_1091258 [Thelephora terrestris]|uniref:Septation initiation network scaffold protein cdc11 n=1 Tax=Thelephora terrestris TaxID=56493 RepID=A0A9P6H3T5_9AGAM|nr:hypothetical protein BJ322DRAFT_1091258 [Thelephora terrestris]